MHLGTPMTRVFASEPMSVDECASILNVSRERIRQLEAAVLSQAAVVLANVGDDE